MEIQNSKKISLDSSVLASIHHSLYPILLRLSPSRKDKKLANGQVMAQEHLKLKNSKMRALQEELKLSFI